MNERVEVEIEGQRDRVVRRGGGGILDMLFVLPGLGFIGFGIALIVWPQLLVYLVAGVFMLTGVGLLVAARKVGRVRRQVATFSAHFGGSREGPASGR